ncbi:MAG TPA: MXAN_5187 family protein [Anaeromyxobacter sp.]|nr:MXAN_5187 family protein [Anaeromyxobacter sp.]
MNRLKLWLFALLVMGLAAAGLRWAILDLRKQALEGVDHRLLAAQGGAEAAERALSAELAAVAGMAAQDERLATAVRAGLPSPEPVPPKKRAAPAPPPPTPEQLDGSVDQAAADAVSAAGALFGSPPPGREVRAASREGLSRRPPVDADAAAFLQDALDHKVRRGYAVLSGKLYAGASVPVGDRGALAVFSPLDDAWAAAAVAGTGATLILAGGPKLVASGRPAEAEALARAAGTSLSPSDAGRLGLLDVAPTWLNLKLPRAKSLLGPLPADRVVARPLSGLRGGRMILALPDRPVLAPLVRLEWYSVAALLLVLLLTIVFGFLIKPTEVAAPVPPELVDAARRIEKGDFSTRAPVLAGKVGTVAAALNRAAEAAQAAPVAPASVTSEFFAKAPEPQPAEQADPFAMPVRAARTAPVGEAAVVSDTARLDGANLSGSTFEAAPVPAARPAPVPSRPAPPSPARAAAPAPPPAPPARTTPAAAAAPDAQAGAVRAVGPEMDEEQHWRDVFRDFVRTRGECGESAEGLTYERFRQKLETNKGALVAKYGCKTVRFQVYVKDGKAALKATPVR